MVLTAATFVVAFATQLRASVRVIGALQSQLEVRFPSPRPADADAPSTNTESQPKIG